MNSEKSTQTTCLRTADFCLRWSMCHRLGQPHEIKQSQQPYQVVATEAAIEVGQRKASREVRRRTQLKNRQQRSIRERLKCIKWKKKIKSNRRAYTAIRGGRARGSSHSNAVINTPSKQKEKFFTAPQESWREQTKGTSQVTNVAH